MHKTNIRLFSLPKWAQKHIDTLHEQIETLERERRAAVKALATYEDSQTESPFFTEQPICDGRHKDRPTFSRQYINGTRCVEVVWEGVHLSITTIDEGGIRFRWSDFDRIITPVAFIPSSFQQASLVQARRIR